MNNRNGASETLISAIAKLTMAFRSMKTKLVTPGDEVVSEVDISYREGRTLSLTTIAVVF